MLHRLGIPVIMEQLICSVIHKAALDCVTFVLTVTQGVSAADISFRNVADFIVCHRVYD